MGCGLGICNTCQIRNRRHRDQKRCLWLGGERASLFLFFFTSFSFSVCFGILILLNWSPRTYTNSMTVPLAHTLARNRKAMNYWWSLLCIHQQNRGHCFWVPAFCSSALVQALSRPQTTTSIGNWEYLGAFLCKLLKLRYQALMVTPERKPDFLTIWFTIICNKFIYTLTLKSYSSHFSSRLYIEQIKAVL